MSYPDLPGLVEKLAKLKVSQTRQVLIRDRTVDIETFQKLPTSEVADIVREAGPKVVVFPINGTRRWFMLEHGLQSAQNLESIYDDYRDITARRYVEVFKLLFDHGLDTLLTPQFGPDLMTRGDAYNKMALEGLAVLTSGPTFVDFYEACDVRVRFYGDYGKALADTPYAYLLAMFDDLTRRTADHTRRRLFYGLFAHDATETVAGLAVRYHTEHGRLPDRRAIVEMYYGEEVGPVDLFIGFDRLSVFDMPLLGTGNEDLYFTVCPSLYLSQKQLREFLYDHLYTRRAQENGNWAAMKEFYERNRDKTVGVGASRQGFWYPLPQVELPPDF